MPKYRTTGDESRRRQAARIFGIGAFFAASFGIIICRAVAFHLLENEKLEKVALRQYRTAVQQSTRRGKILDAVGRELAVNVHVASLYANPRAIADPGRYAEKLSRILKLDRKKLEARLASKRKFVWVKRQVTAEEAKEVMHLSLAGIASMNESRRAYPHDTLASTILGAVGMDAEGLSGVELQYNDVLLSTVSPGEYKRDARGHLYLSPTQVEGGKRMSQIELTIDKTLQYIAERELQTAVRTAKAASGVVIVADVTSGAILAIANDPAFNPNRYADYEHELWKNRAIADVYEPGSTFKVMVIAAALDAGVISPAQVIDCERGRMAIGSKVIHDTHVHDALTVGEVIKVSSNIGAAKIAKFLTPSQLHRALSLFGFARPTGIPLPGEVSGMLAPPSRWSELGRATIAFGQGVGATPLQMAMAFAAIANGGELLKPQIVKRIIDAEGNEIVFPSREVVARPLRPETALLVRKMLMEVTREGGTGTLAASLEYPMAGKTGTAQKAEPGRGGYAEGKYYASFIGFAPADAPRIVVYVGINEPAGELYYGGDVAAPAFRRISEETLRYLKVPASLPGSLPRANSIVAEAPDGALLQAEDAAPRRGVESAAPGKWRIPDFRGLTMRGALEALGQAPLHVDLRGSGVAVDQEPSAGSIVPSGARCHVTFRPLL